MKLTAKVKLQANKQGFAALKETLREANRCCDWLSEQAFDAKIFAQFKIHKRWYKEARKQFPNLTAQCVVRCISKVADSYKLDQDTKRTYNPLGAIAYDLRILHWYPATDTVSIWTVAGRLKLKYIAGAPQKELLKSQQGETDLILYKGGFFLAASCNVDSPTPGQVEDWIGCDLGVKNILTDSDGHRYSGAHVLSVRHRHKRLRTRLQKKGTKSAKRRLKKLAGKEARFAKDVNHRISKEIVALAKGTNRGIVLEDLTGIRRRFTVGRNMRGVLHSWSFSQLRFFTEYKAQREGVPVIFDDPAYSSQECSRCGHISRRNRKDQRTFKCRQCYYTVHADRNAAYNHRCRGRAASARFLAVNQPFVAYRADVLHSDLSDKPTALAVGRWVVAQFELHRI